MRKFWMVLGSGVPVYRHETKDSALREAERLSRCYKGIGFTVLESIGTCKQMDVSWEMHECVQEKLEEDF